MKRLLTVLISFSALFMTSCIDLETSEQLDRIASMNQTIDSVETVLNEQKLDSIGIISNNAYGVENRIKNNYYSDTINLELGRKMDAFKVMRRSLSPINKSLSIIAKSIDEERTKLKELKVDIENGDGKREKYSEFISYEEAKVDQLRVLLTEYVETKEACLKTYNDYYDELNDFSMSLLK